MLPLRNRLAEDVDDSGGQAAAAFQVVTLQPVLYSIATCHAFTALANSVILRPKGTKDLIK